MMPARRQYPPINNEDGFSEIKLALGLIAVALFILIPVLYLTLITDRFDPFHDIQTVKGWINFVLLFSALVICPVIYLIIAIRWLVHGISINHKKRMWKSRVISSQVAIIDRNEIRNEYAECKEQEWDCELAIQLPPSAGSIDNAGLVWARVNQRVYHRYSGKTVAQIYYDPLNPLQFLLDAE